MEVSLTFLLNLAQQGDRKAEGHALTIAYDKLRSMARSLLSRERYGHTLQATALVSEVFIQKLRRISAPIQSREHYYALAAYAMRQVLVDYARRSRANRRVISPEFVSDMLMQIEEAAASADDQLAVQQAFQALAKIDPSAAECIRCRFIAGLTIQQTADRLSRNQWKVRADCDFGLNWMAARLGNSR